MLRRQLVLVGDEDGCKRFVRFFLRLLGTAFSFFQLRHLRQQIPQRREEHAFRQAEFGGIEVHVFGQVYKVVADDFDDGSFFDFAAHEHELHAGVLDGSGQRPRNFLILLGDDLAGKRRGDIFGQHATCDPVGQPELLIVFIAADLRQVVALRIEKQRFDQIVGAFERRRLAGTQLAVDFFETFVVVRRQVFLHGFVQTGVDAEHFFDLFVRSLVQKRRRTAAVLVVAPDLLGQILFRNRRILADFGFDLVVDGLVGQRPQNGCHRLLPRPVHAHGNHLVGVRFVLQPGAPVGDDRRGK